MELGEEKVRSSLDEAEAMEWKMDRKNVACLAVLMEAVAKKTAFYLKVVFNCL